MFHLHAATTLDLSITSTPWTFCNFPIKKGFFFILLWAALPQNCTVNPVSIGKKKRPHPCRACLAPSLSDSSEMLSDQGFNGRGRTLFLSIISDLSFRPRSVLMPYRWGNVSRQVALPLCWFSPLPVTVRACLSSPPGSSRSRRGQTAACKQTGNCQGPI